MLTEETVKCTRIKFKATEKMYLKAAIIHMHDLMSESWRVGGTRAMQRATMFCF